MISVDIWKMMQTPFFARSLIAGLLVAMIAGVLGCFVVWRKMAYFGDALSHSALLGVVTGLVIGVSNHIGIAIVCFCFAITVVWLQRKHVLATDTLLGILAHATLSLGIVSMSLLNIPALDLHSYLFGDILAVRWEDVYWIAACGIVIMAVLWFFWERLILHSLSRDLARAEGMATFSVQVVLMCLIALAVSVSVQVVGVMLVTSMLIIPSAAARFITRTPEGMACMSVGMGVLSVIGGMVFSFYYDTPSGPSIVATATVVFVVLFLIGQKRMA